MTFGAN